MKMTSKIRGTFVKRCIALSILILISACVIGIVASTVMAGDGTGDGFNVSQVHAEVMKWAFLAAAVSVGLGSVGTGIAVAYVGSAALGVVGEKPEMAPRALIFVGLAEGIAIYGLIIAIMILVRV